MKKFLMVLSSLFGAFCVNASPQYMTVELKNGEHISFLLVDKPTVTYEDGNVVVNGSASTSYAVEGIRNFHFTEADVTGVANNSADALCIVRIDDDIVALENAPAGAVVSLFNSNGALVSNAIVDRAGNSSVPFPSQKGVYVLTVGGKSFKLIRK